MYELACDNFALANVGGVSRARRRTIVGEYCRARLIEECEVRGRQADIARITGIKPAHISNVRTGSRNVGDTMAHLLAEKLWSVRYSELERLANEWAKGRDLPFEEPRVALDARYPNLAEAITYREGKWLATTVETLSKIAAHYPEDKSFGDWMTEGDNLDQAFRRQRKGGQPFEPVGDDDDTPPRGRG